MVAVIALLSSAGTCSAAAMGGVERISESRGGSQPLVAFDGRGGVAATWLGGRGQHRVPFAYAQPQGDAFARVRSGPGGAPGELRPAALAAYGNGEALVLAQRVRRDRGGGRHVVVVAFRRKRDGTVTSARRLSPRRSMASESVLGVSRRGDAVAAWVATRASGRRIQYATRRAGGKWSSPRMASAEARLVGDLALSVSAGGNAALMWRRGGRIEVARGRVDGLRPAVLVGTGAKGGLGLGFGDVAVNDAGGVLVAWSRFTDAGFSRDDTVVRAARGTVHGGFAPPVEVAKEDKSSVGVEVALGDDGRAAIVWVGYTESIDPVVRYVGASADGAVGGVRELSSRDVGASNTPDPSYADVQITDAARTVVAWSEVRLGARDESGSSGSIMSIEASADGTWTNPATVWSTDSGTPVYLDLATGPNDRVILAWNVFPRRSGIFVARN